MAIKYTTDGKKVLVVGKLNAQEHIVQEVFVGANGQEIPSGENFVVKNLHDEPVESWKDKDLREREQKYERVKADIERRTKELNDRHSAAQQKTKRRTDMLFDFANNSAHSQLDLLRAWLAGEITHFFVNRYTPQIVTWDDDILYDTERDYGRMSVNGMKLVSLFGRADGRLDYRLHDYRDGSGGWVTIIPCRNYEEALAHAQHRLDTDAALYVAGGSGYINIDAWRAMKGIVIPPAAITKFNERKREAQAAQIEKLRADLAKAEAALAAEEKP